MLAAGRKCSIPLQRRHGALGRAEKRGGSRAVVAGGHRRPAGAAGHQPARRGNVLATDREPWLAIDRKPYLGGPTYDPVQHLLNCEQRLTADPADLTRRMAGLLELDHERLRQWLFARCVQESLDEPGFLEPAVRLATR